MGARFVCGGDYYAGDRCVMNRQKPKVSFETKSFILSVTIMLFSLFLAVVMFSAVSKLIGM